MAQQTVNPKKKWEARYQADGYEPMQEPVAFLVDIVDRLTPGPALCLAAGAGRNAVYLAECGFEVTAVDISPAGLNWCRKLARRREVSVETVAADLLSFDFGVACWELVTDFYYHNLRLFPAIKQAVRPGGHFLFQTYTTAQTAHGWGPSDPDHLVEPAELQSTFVDWETDYFRELDHVVQDGKRESVVQFLTRKPAV